MKQFILRTVFLGMAVFWGSTLIFAQFTASGKVTDENSNPLVGVAVVIKGTNTGTITDMNGFYSLAINSNEAFLEFSYLGYAQ
ncbi:MAG: carboxypeptidase-like regulatory domain-containing protein [Bacteroidota bacterium]|nr:carboxypeptidase-like regulatory domain-containing protein [Bacteroidota bacterium]